MNYRHAFHAGNHADVLKHLALVLILERLRAKATPFAVLDTHAGAGLYDLTSEAAQRSPEWQGGIGRLWDWPEAPPALAQVLDAVRACNPNGALQTYPGSPALAAGALRAQDRYIGCELHPEDARALKLRFASRDNMQIHARDGWEAIKALTPFPERRGLVLIDPPYEREDDIARSVDAIKTLQHRFANAIVLWWRPLKDDALLAASDSELAGPALRADLAIAAPQPAGKLTASSLLIRNPPFGVEDALRSALPALADRLQAGDGGFAHVLAI